MNHQRLAKRNILAKRYLSCLDNVYDIKCFTLLVSDSSNAILKSNIPLYYKECVLAFQEMNRMGLKRYFFRERTQMSL